MQQMLGSVKLHRVDGFLWSISSRLVGCDQVLNVVPQTRLRHFQSGLHFGVIPTSSLFVVIAQDKPIQRLNDVVTTVNWKILWSALSRSHR
jgi:hypothetical protein